ncbi:MAG: hypothetical protein KDB14_35220 [Planctomycetales bacterium]|nr:hypothetical protein [Planctomycetales bacterium]
MTIIENSSDHRMAERIAAGLRRCIGVKKAIKCRQMVDKLKAEGFQNASDTKVRDIIRHLRRHQGMFICADTHGFYMAVTRDDRRHQINSMKSRIKEMNETLQAFLNIEENDRRQAEMDI